MTDTSTDSEADDELDYAAAMAELDTIVSDLEDDKLNVDVLADRVQRASELITFCRARISTAKLQVDQIVAEMDEGGEVE